MYSTSITSTTTSSNSRSTCMDRDRRIRVIKLIRPRRSTATYGFGIRGGREFATGFYVSRVDFNSEAYLQGLKVGDRLITVNGYRVDDAVHSELVHFLASQPRLKLKVRNVGMLPIKEGPHDPVSWHFVSERSSDSDVSSSPTLCYETDRVIDLRLSILVPPRAKLGCGICKGPDWKPGVFVQFVRQGGIAREAGLRPGDQILSCNGIDFNNISFNEAITAMKETGRLELVIREGAGTELVSPESSGYNSSASSAAGERSPAAPVPHTPLAPPAALRRKLASVAEEAADRADKLTLSRLKRRTWNNLDIDWQNGATHNFDIPSDIEPDYDSPSIPNNPDSYENKTNIRNKNKNKDYISNPSNRTIINLTEEGATIHSFESDQNTRKPSSINNFTNLDNDKKTTVVEIHHNNVLKCEKSACDYPPPMSKQYDSDTMSVSSSATLSSAIAEEIQRRSLKKNNTNSENIPPPPPMKRPLPPTLGDEKKKQHDALMDEFKKVHRKMFAANQESEMNGVLESNNARDSLDRQQTLPLRRADQPVETTNNNHVPLKKEPSVIPPPPPPMPKTNGYLNGNHKPNNNEKLITRTTADVVNNSSFRNNETRSPAPDYNKKIEPFTIKSIKDEAAELNSIESYTLKNPSNGAPKPPPNYFTKTNGTSTLKKHTRQVSVTIGEYTYGNGTRREPTKLEFLNGDKPDGIHNCDDEVSISNRLQSELALTLSRSNLRKKTDALDQKRSITQIINEDSDSSIDKIFHARYGNNLLPLPPSITIPKVSISKSKH